MFLNFVFLRSFASPFLRSVIGARLFGSDVLTNMVTVYLHRRYLPRRALPHRSLLIPSQRHRRSSPRCQSHRTPPPHPRKYGQEALQYVSFALHPLPFTLHPSLHFQPNSARFPFFHLSIFPLTIRPFILPRLLLKCSQTITNLRPK